MTNPTGEPTIRRKFQKTDLDGNNNKYYLVEVWPLSSGRVFFRASYGRVGAKPQVDEKTATEDFVEQKIREKERKGYKEVALHKPDVVVVSSDGHTASATQHPREVVEVVDSIFQEAGEHIQTYLQVGVDALSVTQIALGKTLLGTTKEMYQKWQTTQSPTQKAMLTDLVQQFYTAIPTKLPTRIDKDVLVREFCNDFSEQEERLQQLEAALSTYTQQAAVPSKSNVDVLGIEIKHILPTDPTYNDIVTRVLTTRGRDHQPIRRIHRVYSIRIPNERNAFEQNTFGAHRVERQLFHGTGSHNVRHILKSGLIVPKTAAHGRMFGDGIYFANVSTKSTQYCSSRRAPWKFLFLADVAVGDPYIPPDAMSSLKEPPRGHCVWGTAGKTRAWGGHLRYDEIIVYKTEQQTLTHLITFE